VIANTWAAVYRDTDDDVLGDPLSDEEPVDGLDRVVVAITEKSRTVYNEETDELRTIRYGTGRAKAGTDIRKDDRIQDLRSGKWWAVTEVGSGSPGFTGHRDLSFDLRAT
jgi:hypothetical protein